MDKTSFDGLVTIRLPADLKAWPVAKGRERGVTLSEIFRAKSLGILHFANPASNRAKQQ